MQYTRRSQPFHALARERFGRCSSLLRYTTQKIQIVRGIATKTRIGDVDVVAPISQCPHLIPIGIMKDLSPLSPIIISHLNWIGKKYMNGQDMMLLGHNSELRRQIALLFAEICEIEVEYLKLTRDTTEADLKQRRELSKNSVIFHNQAPVRAALHGRLLILDGLDQVERNVLPALNNLLENREMGLDDGGRLGSPSLKVHPNFRVLALGLQTPPYGPGSSLDPPLRSRFSSRFIEELSTDSIMDYHLEPTLRTLSADQMPRLRALLTLYESLRTMRETAIQEGASLSNLPILTLRQMKYCLSDSPTPDQFLARTQAAMPALTWMRGSVNARFQDALGASWETIINSCGGSSRSGELARNLGSDLMNKRHIALLGPKASGKSHLIQQIATQHSLQVLTFPLYSELTSRDLLQRRVTDHDGRTLWIDSSLVAAARGGSLCVLDGVDRLDNHALVALQRLLLDGTIDLPSGERFIAMPNFRVVFLGELTAGSRWISADLNLSYYKMEKMNADEIIAAATESHGDVPPLLQDILRDLHSVEAEHLDSIAPSLRHISRLVRLHKSTNGSASAISGPSLRRELQVQLLVPYLPEASRVAFASVLDKHIPKSDYKHDQQEPSRPTISDNLVTIGDVSCERRVPSDTSYVPAPLFHENPSHNILLQSMLRAWTAGEKSFLFVGNQGVGKNKLVDYFLHLLNAEREYIQLHRDSTVPSLTLIPSLIDGKIVYRDSVVIKAARNGTVLVVDEADKAPSEITFVLKHIAEDGELALSDGRRLLSHEKYRLMGGNVASPDSKTILIHPDFRLFVLANRPGFPFLGNNFFSQVSGVFQSIIVENLDYKSELKLLLKYGPDVDPAIMSKLSIAFSQLRHDHAVGKISYPYSVRENVAVVKHLQAYPQDGIVNAIENIMSFDQLTPSARSHLALAFQQAGIPMPAKSRDGSIYAGDVKLSQSITLPAPIESVLDLVGEKEGRVPMTVKPVKVSPWTSFQTAVQAPLFAFQRLRSFSEHFGTLTVPMTQGSLVSSIVSGGSHHSLSINPLVVHTYKGGVESFLSSENEPRAEMSDKYVAVELLSEEMGWRLGSFTPMLLKAPRGVVVFLPELSMGFRVSYDGPGTVNEPKPSVELLTIPLPKPLLQSVPMSRTGTAISNLFAGSSSSRSASGHSGELCSSSMESGEVSNESISALWRRGGSELAVLNIHKGVVASATMPYGATIDTILFYTHSEKADDSAAVAMFIVSGQNIFQAFVPQNFEEGCVLEVRACAGAIEKIGGISAARHQTTYSSEGGTTVGGSSQSHGGVISQVSPGGVNVIHWPRFDAAASVEAEDTKHSVLLCAVTESKMHNLIGTKGTGTLDLEIVNTDAGTKKRVKVEKSQGKAGEVVSVSAQGSVSAVSLSSGRIELFETCPESLKNSLKSWKAMFAAAGSKKGMAITRLEGGDREGSLSIPKTGLGAPKHGKEDDKEHVGGDTWAGGTGGSDTVGLGGRGGPYRLDKGHKVHQVSDEEKAKVSAEAKEAAAKMAREALANRLRDIQMGKGQFSQYQETKQKVSREILELSNVLEEFARRKKERVWLKNRSDGELDDGRLVDGLTGERLVYKKRVDPKGDAFSGQSQGGVSKKKRFHFLVDCSASMYRFNSSDGRLNRLLEAVLLILESLAGESAAEIEYAITGHSGDSPEIKLLDFDDPRPKNEMERYQILEQMASYSQFSQAGDYTLHGTKLAIRRTIAHPDVTTGQPLPDDNVERFVFAISDANFERYGITKELVRQVITQHEKQVTCSLLLIASRDGEAEKLAQACPGKVGMCLDNADIPKLFKRILVETFRV